MSELRSASSSTGWLSAIAGGAPRRPGTVGASGPRVQAPAPRRDTVSIAGPRGRVSGSVGQATGRVNSGGLLATSPSRLMEGARRFLGMGGSSPPQSPRPQVPGVDLLGSVRRSGGQAIRNLGSGIGYVQNTWLGNPEAARSTRRVTDGIGNFLDPRPPGPPPGTDSQAAGRRANGVPPELDRHPNGPPATPSGRIPSHEIDPNTGLPRTGTLLNVGNADGHQYITRVALPPGITREQGEQTFDRYRAPTTEALYGDGVDPSARRGTVDMRGPISHITERLPRFLQNLLSLGQDGGGEVHMNRGRTPDGRPWAINSTIPDRHPLVGHITRTFEEHNGRYYIRTEGVGSGDDSTWGARHRLNGIVGPPAFGNLDEAAVRYARREFLQ